MTATMNLTKNSWLGDAIVLRSKPSTISLLNVHSTKLSSNFSSSFP